MSDALPNDPLFPLQWHLLNTGQSGGTPGIDLNVVRVWEDYDGSGVVVGVIDDGTETDHPDLAANEDPALGFDFLRPDNRGLPVSKEDMHGTSVSGVIGAVADNGLGGTGVAPGATLGIVHLTLGEPPESISDEALTAESAAIFSYAQEYFDVVNNSWGDSGYVANTPNVQAAIENAVQYGRDGLGTVVVFSAGNNRNISGDSNTDATKRSPFVIAVAAVNHDGVPTFYSSPGTNVLVAAPSDDRIDGNWVCGVVTTDRMGYEGYNTAPSPEGDYAYDFGGTSAAAPEVTGVVALMLEANPDLGYRDVQDILALTARNVDPEGNWAINGATNWNGGGMHVSRDVGYGLVDALAAVRLSETWEGQNTYANLATAESSVEVGQTIPDGQGYVTSSIAVIEDIDVERVVVSFDMEHESSSDLRILLVSPSGTESLLLDQAWPTKNAAWPVDMSLSSTFHLGENSKGTWTLYVADAQGNNLTGTLNSWKIDFYGKEASDDSLYVYTNEYSGMAASDPARTILLDTSGDDVVNVAAVSSGSVVNLTPGTLGLVDGTPLVLAAGTAVETVYAGDGDDGLVGDVADNYLFGGRGNDILMGGLGDDVLDGGQKGVDTAVYTGSRLDYQLVRQDDAVTVSGPEGTDLLRNIDVLSFADGIYAVSALYAPGFAGATGILAS
ncbi:S8 family serine peptidase [Solidesulfovibrio carbinolicus]|uniref:Regulatory P domain of subtilisin-like proprotein convertase n=1 Tax=Solidesulfovibrio carbinolicus TaxID=296842 RepID=A0A4P6HT78_9BACT|nr:S8 family serine peptidase [Solidesulfovibrio carbinolicus]QAZ68638.1 regulatory P domain of subtilisin-like proprotein convertase [Solidesulfovibrio carbinolicus]